jgi:methyl-accepting chemotaxis protein
MGQLDTATQQSASSSEELAATSEELSAQAESLQQSVAFFKLVANENRSNNSSHTAPAQGFSEQTTNQRSMDQNNELDPSDFERF